MGNDRRASIVDIIAIIGMVIVLAVLMVLTVFEPLSSAEVCKAGLCTNEIALSPIDVKTDAATDFQKQDKITYSTRAPHSKDKSSLWIQYTENSDTTMKLWIRHPKSGTWRSATAS